MSFSFGDTHSPRVNPAKKLELRRRQGQFPSFPPPKTAIFCYHSQFLKSVLQGTNHHSCKGSFSQLFFMPDQSEIAIADFGSGASVSAHNMEELIAWGVEQFISMGIAGSLQNKAKIGDLIVCEKAIRDERTSHQYLPPTKYIHAPRRMTNKLMQQLKKAEIPFLIGSTWTRDSLSCKAEQVTYYQKEGVIAVDKETSALFAVAHFYQVDLGTVLTISDARVDLAWQSHPEEDTRSTHGLQKLLAVAMEAAKK